MRRARAYGSSCSQVILDYLHPIRRNVLFCSQKSSKDHLKSIFSGFFLKKETDKLHYFLHFSIWLTWSKSAKIVVPYSLRGVLYFFTYHYHMQACEHK